MIIVSKNNKNSSVKFSGVKVSFDEKNQAKVAKELGESILKNFPNDYWEEGKRPTAQKKDDDILVDDVQVQRLKDEVFRLKGIIETKDGAIQTAKDGEKTWRDAYQKLQDEMSGKGNSETDTPKPEAKKEESKVEFIPPEKHKDLYDAMNEKNFNGLKKWIKEKFSKTDEDLKEVSGKDGLIKFVFEKCEIGN